MTVSATPLELDVDVPGMTELLVGGIWVEPASGDKRDVVSPSSERTIATVVAPSYDDADRALAAARLAFNHGPWPRMTLQQRVAECARFCDELESHSALLARTWMFESGVTESYAKAAAEITAPRIWRNLLDVALAQSWEERRSSSGVEVLLCREPVGPVLAILTYNSPLALLGMKVMPALLAGCPVILKPAPESALIMRVVAECAINADLPSGVLSILAADTAVTQHLVASPDISLISVTGGTSIGLDVVQRSAPNFTRTLLELGGKSPAIIGDNVDFNQVLETLVDGCSRLQGQVCTTLSRVLFPRSRYDEMVEGLAARLASLKVGDPFDATTERGPLAVERARTRSELAVARAIEQGGTIVVGGNRPSHLPRGWYFEPTLVSSVNNAMDIAQDEIFGPVTCAIPYDSLDEAIRLANDSKYGLAGSVYMKSPEQALAVARQIRSGTLAINTAGICVTEPFGGVKHSGWGRECGAEGLLEFTEYKQYLLG